MICVHLTGVTVCGMCVSHSVTICGMCVSDRCFVPQTTTQRASHSLTEFLPSASIATECSSDITRLWKKMDPWQKLVSGTLFQEMSDLIQTAQIRMCYSILWKFEMWLLMLLLIMYSGRSYFIFLWPFVLVCVHGKGKHDLYYSSN